MGVEGEEGGAAGYGVAGGDVEVEALALQAVGVKADVEDELLAPGGLQAYGVAGGEGKIYLGVGRGQQRAGAGHEQYPAPHAPLGKAGVFALGQRQGGARDRACKYGWGGHGEASFQGAIFVDCGIIYLHYTVRIMELQ